MERTANVATTLLRLAFLAIVAGLLTNGPAMCADMVVTHTNHEWVSLSISGEIARGDDLEFARLVGGAKHILVRIESAGGDLDTAMNIGRTVRKGEGQVFTGGCFSACVLIFAGGVVRTGAGPFDEPVVGVHRIFFSQLKPGLSSNEVKARYDAQLSRVRSYLSQMNVAPDLLSFMQSIQPGDMHVMQREELNRYGLGANDVIFEERMVADRAAELKISSLEYRRRQQRGHEECNDIAGPTKEETVSAQAECAQAIHYGTSIEVYRLRRTHVNARCGRYTDQTQQNRCQVQFMSTGRAIP